DDNDCGTNSHCQGEVFGQAAWHLMMNMKNGRSYADNAPIAGGALDEESAWYHLERLYFNARPLAEVMDPRAEGVSLYDAIALADQDLMGRHPYAAYYNEALDHHGLAESSPVTPDNRCTLLSPPVVQTGQGYDDQTGLHYATLAFSDVGADYYRCYRREGAVGPMLPTNHFVVGPFSGQRIIQDDGLEPGKTYEYIVRAFNGTRCISRGTNLVRVTIGSPDIRITRHAEWDPSPGGDGDRIVEPGEWIDMKVWLSETGGMAGVHGVALTIETDDPEVVVINGGPVGYDDIPAGEERMPDAKLRFFVRLTHECDSVIPFRATIETAEGCYFDWFEISIPAAACQGPGQLDLDFAGFEIVSDSENAECTDGDLIPDNEEWVDLAVQYANSGVNSLTGGTVELILNDPRMIVVSANPWTFDETLRPGEEGTAIFRLAGTGFNCQESLAFVVLLQPKQSLRPKKATFSLTVEEDVVPGTAFYDFENGLQGWTIDTPWALSTSRSNPSDQGTSVYSGNGDNLCSDLISPPLLLAGNGMPTLSLHTWFEYQPLFQAKYWDGAAVFIESDGKRVHVAPVSGRGYIGKLFTNHPCEGGKLVFSGNSAGTQWQESVFDLSPWAGEEISIIVRNITDNLTSLEGIYVDDITVTEVLEKTCDGNQCFSLNDCSTPQMTLSAPSEGCSGTPITFTATFDYYGQGSFRYQWVFGDGNVLPVNDPQQIIEHA
ncbi:hypothetical protein ACFLU6_16440, partial [Acidobacteriota bacterium]